MMHLEGVAYYWWHYGFVTEDHGLITSYETFIYKPITHFDRKNIEVYYKDLAQLRKGSSLDDFIDKFLQILVMVLDKIEQCKLMLFTEGLRNRY